MVKSRSITNDYHPIILFRYEFSHRVTVATNPQVLINPYRVVFWNTNQPKSNSQFLTMIIQGIFFFLLTNIMKNISYIWNISQPLDPPSNLLQFLMNFPQSLMFPITIDKPVNIPINFHITESRDLPHLTFPHRLPDPTHVGPSGLRGVYIGYENEVSAAIGSHFPELFRNQLGHAVVAVGLAGAEERLIHHCVRGEGHGGDHTVRFAEPAGPAQKVDDRAVVLHRAGNPHGTEYAEAVVDKAGVVAPAEDGEVCDGVRLDRAGGEHFVEQLEGVSAAAVDCEGHGGGVPGDQRFGVEGAEEGDGAGGVAASGVHVDERVADAGAGVEAEGGGVGVDGGAFGEGAELGAGGDGGDDGDGVGRFPRGRGAASEAVEEGKGVVGEEGEEEGVPGGNVAEWHFVEGAESEVGAGGFGVGVDEGGEEADVGGEAEAEEVGVEGKDGGERGEAGGGFEGEGEGEGVGAGGGEEEGVEGEGGGGVRGEG